MSSDDLPHQAIELRDLLCAEEAWQRQQPQQLAKQAASDEGAAEAASPHAAPEAQPAKRLPPPRPHSPPPQAPDPGQLPSKGSAPKSAQKGHPPQPAAKGHPPQPAAKGHPPQPAAKGHPPQPAAKGHPPQPAAKGSPPKGQQPDGQPVQSAIATPQPSQPATDDGLPERLRRALRTFVEPVDTSVLASVPRHRSFAKVLEEHCARFLPFICSEEDISRRARILSMVSDSNRRASRSVPFTSSSCLSLPSSATECP
jgi:hypothetical protein